MSLLLHVLYSLLCAVLILDALDSERVDRAASSSGLLEQQQQQYPPQQSYGGQQQVFGSQALPSVSYARPRPRPLLPPPPGAAPPVYNGAPSPPLSPPMLTRRASRSRNSANPAAPLESPTLQLSRGVSSSSVRSPGRTVRRRGSVSSKRTTPRSDGYDV